MRSQDYCSRRTSYQADPSQLKWLEVVRESESADGESTRERSWESMRTPGSQSEEASTHDALDADKTCLYRSAVARLNYWAVVRLDIQYAVRVCSKSMSSPRVSDWQRLKRVARYVKRCPDTEINSTDKTRCAKRQ